MGFCFLACETSKATPSQPPPWQGEELFDAFFGIYLINRPKICIRDSSKADRVGTGQINQAERNRLMLSRAESR